MQITCLAWQYIQRWTGWINRIQNSNSFKPNSVQRPKTFIRSEPNQAATKFTRSTNRLGWIPFKLDPPSLTMWFESKLYGVLTIAGLSQFWRRWSVLFPWLRVYNFFSLYLNNENTLWWRPQFPIALALLLLLLLLVYFLIDQTNT